MALSTHNKNEVRRQVAHLLSDSPAFSQLPPGERAEVLENTRRVVESMADARRSARDPFAVVLADEPASTGRQKPAPQRATSGEFGMGVDKGVDQIARLIDEVGFPEFCAALIHGVFQSIVDTSIQQMKAYAEMVKGVTSSLNDFKDQNVSPNQGKDHLVSKYPRLFRMEIGKSGPRVAVRDDIDTDNLPNFQAELGMDEPVEDLDEAALDRLVEGARLEVAKGRQQLLATLVLMGINRIVVTDGKIKARVKFNFSSSDTQNVTATSFDYQNMGNINTTQYSRDVTDERGEVKTESKDGGWTRTQGPASRYLQESWQSASVPDVRLTNQTDTYTDASINAAAEMLGEVSINFKSETFPLEKLVNTDQVAQIQSRQQGAGLRGTPAPGAPTGAPAPAAPPPTPPPAGG